MSIARLTEAIYIRYKDSQSRLPFLVVPASILALVSFVGILLNASLLYVTVKGKFVIDFFDFLSTDNAGEIGNGAKNGAKSGKTSPSDRFCKFSLKKTHFRYL